MNRRIRAQIVGVAKLQNRAEPSIYSDDEPRHVPRISLFDAKAHEQAGADTTYRSTLQGIGQKASKTHQQNKCAFELFQPKRAIRRLFRSHERGGTYADVPAPIISPPAEAIVRLVMDTLAATYHGRGAIELGDPFKVLVSTIVSQRTREEDTTRISNLLFARYSDARALARAEPSDLVPMLAGSLYPEIKAPRLVELANILVSKYGGEVPDDIDSLLALPGVGRKTANCVLIYAFEKPAICVDVHCHRITNRLGWVATKTPDQTERKLERILPKDWWIGSNRLFLQHGRAICLPSAPRCGNCPVQQWCAYGANPDAPKSR